MSAKPSRMLSWNELHLSPHAMKTLPIVWLSSAATFALTCAVMLPQRGNINHPGEVGEVLTGVGITLLCLLLLVTGVAGFVAARNTGKKP